MELNKFYNCDCMEYMKTVPDKFFELAIVDPPYGIGAGSKKFINGTSKTKKEYYKENDWDILPSKLYFYELFRISNNQIIFGGNYFIEFLKNTRCFIFWDKMIHGNSYADGELLWTSFDKPARIYIKNICQVEVEGERIHPTQKTIHIYKYLLINYAKPGDKIFDSHVGSGSSIIACIEEKHDYVGCELDEDYYKAASERIRIFKEQLRMF